MTNVTLWSSRYSTAAVTPDSRASSPVLPKAVPVMEDDSEKFVKAPMADWTLAVLR